MAALAASQKALREQKEAADKAAEQYSSSRAAGTKLREAETARDKLKAEVAEVRGQLDAARADAEGQKAGRGCRP